MTEDISAVELAEICNAILEIAVPFCKKKGKRIVVIDTEKNCINFKD